MNNPTPQAHGFTLLEVMLVVLIIGIVTSLAVYSMAPAGPARHAKSEAETLMATLDFAQQQAIVSHQPYGLVVQDHGYQFYVYQGHWQAATGKAFQIRELKSKLQLLSPKAQLDGSPNILFMPSKEPQVFELRISQQGFDWFIRSLPPYGITLRAGVHE